MAAVIHQLYQLLWPWGITSLVMLLSPLLLFWTKREAHPDKGSVKTSREIIRTSRPASKTEVKQDNIVVSALYVHPVKSCRGTSVKEARWTSRGFQYDRQWCIIDEDDYRVVTLRTVGELTRIIPRIEVDSVSPHGGLLTVDVPNGSGYDTFSVPLDPTPEILNSWRHIAKVTMLFDPDSEVDGFVCQSIDLGGRSPSEILSAFLKKQVLLVMKGSGDRFCPPSRAFPELKTPITYTDAYPVMIATQESLDSLNSTTSTIAKLGKEAPKGLRGVASDWESRLVEMERFRPNIVTKGTGVPYAEDIWREIEFDSGNREEGNGCSQVMVAVKECARCTMPNVDPNNGARDPAVPNNVIIKYGLLDHKSKPVFGTYMVPNGSGIVRVGDRMKVRKWIEDD